ncbi:centrosomal protein of 89 kDa isoform X3 [Malaclemys terrapin pileata]|uniref:centrosomal protein of 89 kDa isoform X3 n=1 Tax=Malaclemys terrapin pileata TaxID=2991368 RepID=UPI0023A8C1DB|nr:centrosomal protein of 89 kDa isoform X3 [Malaclemys terrapin pileata]
MALSFRRGRTGPFKHIAHGLVPAATIAPKPAVPRTPPPRSPNPSPERPRSALAAAILVTTLTGRTIAIPQPRQRSLSESDTSCLEQECFIEPYATVTELKLGPNWKHDDSERSPVQSLEVSGNPCKDEDMDTYLSETEKEPEHNYQGAEKREESFSNDAIYAVPYKNKKVKLPVSSSVDLDENKISSHEAAFPILVDQSNIQVEEDEPPVLNLKEQKLAVENPLSEKPPPSPDVSVRARQGRMETTKEKFQELKQENWSLINANQTMALQLEELKQQIKELQLKLKTLEKENKKCRKAAESSHKEEEVAELLSLRQQAQELVDENDGLKMTVHRLNVELSRYQTKFRPLSQDENIKIGGLPTKGPPPPWLLDMKYLSPLLLAYEDRMREKEDLNLAHEEDMKKFRIRVEELVKENEQLHQQLNKNSSVTLKEWQQLQTQAKLVLEENGVLMEQLEIQQAKAKESYNQHLQEVSKLTKQLMVLEAKKQSQEEEISENQKQLKSLCSTCEELKANLNGRVTAEEHVALVNALRSQLQQEQEKQSAELGDLMERLASLQAQKKSLLLEKNDLVAENKILEAELKMAQKTNRKSQKKIGLLKQQLGEAMEKEVAAHQYLANLISLAENISQERDHLIHLAKCLESEKHGVLNKIIEGNVRLGRLEEKVRVYKKKAAGKLGDINLKMTEQEKEFAGKASQYQREMKHLQRLLQDKQETLDEVLQQKREVEGELEIVWESTSKENRRMKEFLHKSLEKNNMWSTVRVYESYLDEISQKDFISGYDFSYCDVKPSSPTKNQSKQEPLC